MHVLLEGEEVQGPLEGGLAKVQPGDHTFAVADVKRHSHRLCTARSVTSQAADRRPEGGYAAE
jgi:hypothetical protein